LPEGVIVRIFRDPARRVHLLIDEPRGVPPILRDPAAPVFHPRHVAVLVVEDAAVVDDRAVVVAPGAHAPAFRVLPVPLEEEGDAAPRDLLHHHAAAVAITNGVPQRIVGRAQAVLVVVLVADQRLAL